MGAMAVLRHSRAWLDVLGSARYLVNNDVFPDYFRKRPGQLYVQTWHGSPIRRLARTHRAPCCRRWSGTP